MGRAMQAVVVLAGDDDKPFCYTSGVASKYRTALSTNTHLLCTVCVQQLLVSIYIYQLACCTSP